MGSVRSMETLQREVLPPQKLEHGFGVLLLASMAMLLAVMSSAFIVSARHARTCPVVVPVSEFALPQAPHVTVSHPAGHPMDISGGEFITVSTGQSVTVSIGGPAPVGCGRPVYGENADGSVSVFFEVCPQDAAPRWRVKTPDASTSVEVDEIR